MIEIGLQPTDTGELGGKQTGASVTHLIIPGGRYARAYAALKRSGFTLGWNSAADGPANKKKAKAASKTKYTCPECDLNAWAKPGAALLCGDCSTDEEGEPAPQVRMEEAD